MQERISYDFFLSQATCSSHFYPAGPWLKFGQCSCVCNIISSLLHLEELRQIFLLWLFICCSMVDAEPAPLITQDAFSALGQNEMHNESLIVWYIYMYIYIYIYFFTFQVVGVLVNNCMQAGACSEGTCRISRPTLMHNLIRWVLNWAGTIAIIKYNYMLLAVLL